jgi:hypothetical protein
MRRAASGAWQRVVKRGADIIHPQMSIFDKPVGAELQQAIDALHELEVYRDPCIRLGKDVTCEIIDACDAAYEQVLAITARIVSAAADST